MTQYYWLNQRPEEDSHYQDSVGDAYHFTDKNRGGKSIEKGDRFLYYLPGDHLIFGQGVFGEVKKATDDNSDTREHYIAHIDVYEEVEPPTNVREIREEISFLRNQKGLRGVPQESIRAISEKEFKKLIES